jgi:hypothetical protein
MFWIVFSICGITVIQFNRQLKLNETTSINSNSIVLPSLGIRDKQCIKNKLRIIFFAKGENFS